MWLVSVGRPSGSRRRTVETGCPFARVRHDEVVVLVHLELRIEALTRQPALVEALQEHGLPGEPRRRDDQHQASGSVGGGVSSSKSRSARSRVKPQSSSKMTRECREPAAPR
jgi:hypothetical protein